jgi:hypothetical protein
VAEGGLIELAVAEGGHDCDKGSFEHASFLPAKGADAALPTRRR